MFDLIGDMLLFASYGNYNALANISISYFDVFLVYIVVIITSIVAGLVLKLPLLPSEPKRYSFDVSALYPKDIAKTILKCSERISSLICLKFKKTTT